MQKTPPRYRNIMAINEKISATALHAYLAVLFVAAPAAQSQPITWTNVAPLGLDAWQENMQAITYGNGVFVTAGWSAGVSGTSRRIALTSDLATWSYASFPENTPSGFMPRRAGYGNGLYAIGGIGNPTSNTNKLVTSPDGLTWTLRDVKLGHVYGLKYANGLWIATGDSGNNTSSLATSSD